MTKREGAAEHALKTLMAGDIRDYLLANPDFFIENSDILAELIPPNLPRADGVQDFQHYMLHRLQSDLAALKSEHDDLMTLMQEHLQRQNRIYAAILSLFDAPDFATVISFVTSDLRILFDHEAVSLFIESDGETLHTGTYEGLRIVESGFVEAWLGNRDVALEEKQGVPELFGDHARRVASQALVRLEIEPGLPQGLLALGHRDAMYYATGLATEQVECLGAVIERCLCKWLHQKAA